MWKIICNYRALGYRALCFPAEWSTRYLRLDETSWCSVLNIGSCPLTVRQTPIQPAVHAQPAWKILNRKTFAFKIHLNGTWGEKKKQKPTIKWEIWKQEWACLSAQADTLFWCGSALRGEVCPPWIGMCAGHIKDWRVLMQDHCCWLMSLSEEAYLFLLNTPSELCFQNAKAQQNPRYLHPY